jgi:hypothetical protein
MQKVLNTSAYWAFDMCFFFLLYCTNDYFQPQAMAQANGFGFSKNQARPKAVSGQQSGPAWPGFFWPGLAWLLASGRSWHITKYIISRQQYTHAYVGVEEGLLRGVLPG